MRQSTWNLIVFVAWPCMLLRRSRPTRYHCSRKPAEGGDDQGSAQARRRRRPLRTRPTEQARSVAAKSDKPTALVMNVHGGGFYSGDKRVFPPGRSLVVERGFSSRRSITLTMIRFTCPFRTTTPLGRYSSPLQRQKWKIDPRRVGLYGGSQAQASFCGCLPKDWLTPPVRIRSPANPPRVMRVCGRGSVDLRSARDGTMLGPRIADHPFFLRPTVQVACRTRQPKATAALRRGLAH